MFHSTIHPAPLYHDARWVGTVGARIFLERNLGQLEMCVYGKDCEFHKY